MIAVLTNVLPGLDDPVYRLYALIACSILVFAGVVLTIADKVLKKNVSSVWKTWRGWLIMIPIILPVAVNYGIDPVHLGIIFLANMQIGYFTPPVGMNLFIASYRFDKSITELYQATIPFMIVLLIAVLIITYWPALSLVFLQR